MLEILIPVILVICILFVVWFFTTFKSFNEEAKKWYGEKTIPYRCDLEEKE